MRKKPYKINEYTNKNKLNQIKTNRNPKKIKKQEIVQLYYINSTKK